jgi:hypothetical protein
MRECSIAVVVVALVGFAFGAGDQYLGTLTAANALGWWSVSLSGLSAPWLVLPFLAGSRQRLPRRSALVGEVIVWAALAGYFAMTLSPMEGVHFHVSGVASLVRSNWPTEIGGTTLGPVFGWLGYRWTTHRSRLAAVLIAGVLCLEPAAVVAVGRGADRSHAVWIAEVMVGIGAGAFFLASARWRRRNPA